MSASVFHALAAAALFGASTPFAKLLVGELPPLLLACLLYLGSCLRLTLIRLVRDRGWQASGLTAGEWPWLAGKTQWSPAATWHRNSVAAIRRRT